MTGEGGTPPDASSGPAIEDFSGRPARRTSNAGGMFRSDDGGGIRPQLLTANVVQPVVVGRALDEDGRSLAQVDAAALLPIQALRYE